MEKTKGMESWYASKTKWGALLIALSFILATVGGMFTGTIDAATGFSSLLVEIGSVLAVFGIRDWPVFNNH